jgi:steroid delta-isomerase-like uncharacterized protein
MRYQVVAVGFAGILALTMSCTADPADAHQDTVRPMIDAINARDFDVLDELIAPDIHRHSAATAGITVENLDQFKEFLRQDLAAVPDAQQEIDFMLADEDLVAVRAVYRGTQQGQFGPFPPSNKQLQLPLIGILRLEGGKIAEMWVEWDNLNALTQLGHFPPPPQVDSVSAFPR